MAPRMSTSNPIEVHSHSAPALNQPPDMPAHSPAEAQAVKLVRSLSLSEAEVIWRLAGPAGDHVLPHAPFTTEAEQLIPTPLAPPARAAKKPRQSKDQSA